MIPIRDSVPSHSVPVVTRALIFINVLVFFFELMLPRGAIEPFFYLFGFVPARFTHPDWAAEVGFPVGTYWPILTHQFLHGGFLHVLFNMWALWIFGDNVEDRMGPVRFAIFYLACGAMAALTHRIPPFQPWARQAQSRACWALISCFFRPRVSSYYSPSCFSRSFSRFQQCSIWSCGFSHSCLAGPRLWRARNKSAGSRFGRTLVDSLLAFCCAASSGADRRCGRCNPTNTR